MRRFVKLTMFFPTVSTSSQIWAKIANCDCSSPIVDRKAIYDIYGEYGLKEGLTTPDGKKIGGGYFLKQEPERYFEKILSNTEFLLEPRAVDGSDVQQSIFADALGGLTQPKKD